MEELKNFHNWRTDSLITYFHNSLLKKTRKEIDFIQKYIVNMQVIPTEIIFELHDYRTYRYIDIPPLDYCDLNMYFLNYFPELLSEYKHLVLNYFGDDTNAGFTYSVLLASYLSNHINDKMIHSKITDFFNKVVELPNRKEGISPIGLIMGNGTGVVSRLKKQNINIDYTI